MLRCEMERTGGQLSKNVEKEVLFLKTCGTTTKIASLSRFSTKKSQKRLWNDFFVAQNRSRDFGIAFLPQCAIKKSLLRFFCAGKSFRRLFRECFK